MSEPTDQIIGKKYRILKELGTGGMGKVFQARDISLDRTVAIKALHVELEARPKDRERFLREARSLAKLEHPNVLQIYELVDEVDIYYMVTQYVSGGTLKQKINTAWADDDSEGLDPEFIIKVASSVARALDYAHNNGIIHRDIKPGNVLLAEDGRVLLGDFGIAKMTDLTRDASLTGEGKIIGTPTYMSPEQINNYDLGPQSDVYSLAIVTYQMLTGECPFKGSTISVINQHLNVPPPPIIESHPEIPIAVQQALFKALEKEPAKRFARAGDFASALQKAFSEITREMELDHGSITERIRESALMGTLKLRRRRKATQKVERGSFFQRVASVILPLLISLVLIVLAISILAVFALSFGLSSFTENQVAQYYWDFTNTYVLSHNEEILSSDISAGLETSLPDTIASAAVNFTSPNVVEFSVERPNGKTYTLFGEISLNDAGRPIVSFQKINDLPLSIFGNIVAGGINRGLDTALTEENCWVQELTIDNESINLDVACEGR
jgi:serine/threonine protein kinase